MSKYTFRQGQIVFLGKTISKHGIAPLLEKIDNFLTNPKLSIPVNSI